MPWASRIEGPSIVISQAKPSAVHAPATIARGTRPNRASASPPSTQAAGTCASPAPELAAAAGRPGRPGQPVPQRRGQATAISSPRCRRRHSTGCPPSGPGPPGRPACSARRSASSPCSRSTAATANAAGDA